MEHFCFKKKELKFIDKMMLALAKPHNYFVYNCKEHGVFQQPKSKQSNKCPLCQKEGSLIEDVWTLKQKYQKELFSSKKC